MDSLSLDNWHLNLDRLNAWLLDKCIAYAKAHHHPELTEQTNWEVFEAERINPTMIAYAPQKTLSPTGC